MVFIETLQNPYLDLIVDASFLRKINCDNESVANFYTPCFSSRYSRN